MRIQTPKVQIQLEWFRCAEMESNWEPGDAKDGPEQAQFAIQGLKAEKKMGGETEGIKDPLLSPWICTESLIGIIFHSGIHNQPLLVLPNPQTPQQLHPRESSSQPSSGADVLSAGTLGFLCWDWNSSTGTGIPPLGFLCWPGKEKEEEKSMRRAQVWETKSCENRIKLNFKAGFPWECFPQRTKPRL